MSGLFFSRSHDRLIKKEEKDEVVWMDSSYNVLSIKF